MRELLKKWSELESDRCGYGFDKYYSSYDREYCQVMLDNQLTWAGPRNGRPDDGYYLPQIQYAVQQAIEAHGWYFVIQPSPSQYEAVVYKTLTEGSDHYFISESIPEALLSAYLEALEKDHE